jgi:tetratricopeptide (TPR) repeat protein
MFISALARIMLAATIVATPIIGLAAPQATQTASVDDLRSRQSVIEARQQDEKESIEKQIESVEKEIDALNTRVNDARQIITFVYNGISVFGLLISVLGLALGTFAIRRAEDKAREAARKSAKEWMDDHSQDLRRETDDRTKQMRSEFDQLKIGVQTLAYDAETSIDAARYKTERRAEETIAKLAAVQRLIDADKPPSQDRIVDAQVVKDAKDAENVLKDKPENKYSATDWIGRGLAAYAENKFEFALEYFSEAAETRDATSSEVARALVNKGVTLGQLNRSEDAIAVNDEVVARFGDAAEPELREEVARALFNKGITLGQLNRSEDEIAVYDEVLARFGDAAEPELRKIVEETKSLRGFNDTPGQSLFRWPRA